MTRVVWSARAEQDVDAIIDYVRQFDPAAALQLAGALNALAASLMDFPQRGRPVSHGARELTTVPPYVLRYRVSNDVVLIVRVHHGRRRPLR